MTLSILQQPEQLLIDTTSSDVTVTPDAIEGKSYLIVNQTGSNNAIFNDGSSDLYSIGPGKAIDVCYIDGSWVYPPEPFDPGPFIFIPESEKKKKLSILNILSEYNYKTPDQYGLMRYKKSYSYPASSSGSSQGFEGFVYVPWLDRYIIYNSAPLAAGTAPRFAYVDGSLKNEWTVVFSTADTIGGWIDVAVGDDIIVAVANNGTTPTVQFSSDGITWTEVTFSGTVPGQFTGVTFANGIFLATCDISSAGTYLVMKSTDGMSWSSCYSTTGGYDPVAIYKLVHDTDSGDYAFFGFSYDATYGGTWVKTTDGGVTWTNDGVASPATPNPLEKGGSNIINSSEFGMISVQSYSGGSNGVLRNASFPSAGAFSVPVENSYMNNSYYLRTNRFFYIEKFELFVYASLSNTFNLLFSKDLVNWHLIELSKAANDTYLIGGIGWDDNEECFVLFPETSSSGLNQLYCFIIGLDMFD